MCVFNTYDVANDRTNTVINVFAVCMNDIELLN
jgi:hypothetical protein